MRKPMLEAVHLDAVDFAADDYVGRPALAGLHVKPGGAVEATNGHYLVRVSPSAIPQEDGTAMHDAGIPDGGVVVEPDAIKAAARLIDKKAMIPVCKAVQVGAETLTVALSGSVRHKPINGTFPDSDRAIPDPTDETHTIIGFDARYLFDMMKYAKKHAVGRNKPVLLSVPKDPSRPMRVDFETENGAKVVMVVMPVRL